MATGSPLALKQVRVSEFPTLPESVPHLPELCSDLSFVAGSLAALSGPGFSNSCFFGKEPRSSEDLGMALSLTGEGEAL